MGGKDERIKCQWGDAVDVGYGQRGVNHTYDRISQMLEERSFYPFPQCSVPSHRDPLFSSTLFLPVLSHFSPLLCLFFFCSLSLVLKYVLPTWNTSEQRGTLLNTSVNDHQDALHRSAKWSGRCLSTCLY